MARTVADFVLERLHAWGVRQIYGYSGDGINGFLGALDRQRDQIRFLSSPHEELASFMACAHAKFTGEVGVCMATAGPGAVHLLAGLYDAHKDHQGVLVILGQQMRTALGSDYQQEVDLVSLYKDVAGQYVHMCTDPAQARHLVDRAMRIAKAERAVTCLIFPHDVQLLDAMEAPPREHGSVFTGIGYTPPRVVPTRPQLEEAARILNEGKKVAILLGIGAWGAEAEVMEVAERLGAGVAKALLGKAVLPDTLPYVTGSIGLFGTEATDRMMQACDTLLWIGSAFPYSEWLPREGTVRCVQIDIQPRMLSLRFPADVALCGDTKPTLQELIPLLVPKEDRSWRRLMERNIAASWESIESSAMKEAKPLNPARVFWELSPRLPDRAILTCDTGTGTAWWARILKFRSGMMASCSGGLATMGCGIPYALAAKFTHPDRPVLATAGDGAMQMIGNNGLITVAERWREWQDPRFVVLVLNNGDLSMVTWEQRFLAGDPRNPETQAVPPFDYAAYAELLGLVGLTMRSAEDVAPVWEQALAAEHPVVINAIVDPDVPPLPPHIKPGMARKFMASMLSGDPEASGVIIQSLKQLFSR